MSKQSPSPTNVMRLALILVIVAGALPVLAQEAGLRETILGLSGQRRVKIVWIKDTTDEANHFRGGADVFKLMGYDTDDDTIRPILPAIDDYTRPILTPDGERIVYTDLVQNKIFVVNWDGTNQPRILLEGPVQHKAGAVWYDPPPDDREWVYYEKGDPSGDPNIFDSIRRVDLDNPGMDELVWNQTLVSHAFLTVSSDGTRVAGSFPWPDSGLIVPRYDGSGGGAIYHPPTLYYIAEDGSRTGGCWPMVTPDERYIFAVFNRYPYAHRHWNVWDWPPGDRRELDLHSQPGNAGWEVIHPRMSNHPQFLTLDGPYSNGPMGENNIAEGGPQVEIHLGKVNAAFTLVTDWVQITHDDRADFFPHAWVASNSTPPVRIDSFTAAPPVILEGGTSTLSWATRNSTSVSIAPGVGPVDPTGSVPVSPASDTAYTLTAEGVGGPQTRQVTVSVVSVTLPLAVDCGDGDPPVAGWLDEDAFCTGGAAYDFSGPVDLNDQPDPAPAGVYLSCIHQDHTCSFPIPDGTYTVRLHFYDQHGGDRRMDFTIEGSRVLDDFDIVAAAGGVEKALVRAYTVEVSDGDGLQIEAEKDSGDDALVSGIEILEGGIADTEEPTVTIVSPAEGETLSGNVTVEGTASDDVAVARVEVSVDGGAWSEAEGTASWTHTLFALALPDGEHEVVARATDPSGNQGQTSLRILTENAPSITVVSPAGGEVWEAGSTENIRWTTENLKDATIRYSTDGGRTYQVVAPSLADHQPGWGDYPWEVADVMTRHAVVLVHGYEDSTVRDESATFALEPREQAPGPLEVLRVRFRGRAPGEGMTEVLVDGEVCPVQEDGMFEAEVAFPPGVESVTFVVEGTDGEDTYLRMMKLEIGADE